MTTFTTLITLLHKNSASKITITSTNLRGSNTGTQKETNKLHTFFDLESDINIVIDSHICESKLSSLRKRHRQLFSKYTIHGNPTKLRGILIFVKKSSGCNITNASNHGNHDTLFFTITLPDNSTIDTVAIYAPSKDTPEFWENAYKIIEEQHNPNKLIIGDFNCTLNHELDQQGYKTDPHTKSRKVINQLLEEEIFIDSYRHMNPETRSYTFRTKNGKKRGRLDYGLISPSLIPFLHTATHIAHHYDNTDHSTLSLEIDITNTPKGKGIFRCPPNLHKDINYQILIKNTIKKAIFSCISKTRKTELQEALFDTRLKLYEEYMSLHTKTPNWNTQSRKDTLEYTMNLLLSFEPTNEELLENELTINKAALLEYVLLQMKNNTISHMKQTQSTETNTEHTLKKQLQALIEEEESEENMGQIYTVESQLRDLETKKLYDILSKKHNYTLLNDERPTKTFLNLENSKGGYSEITRLRIKNPKFNPNMREDATNIPYFEITDSTQIRRELHNEFQNIYKAQPNLNTTQDAITEFLCSDGDTKPLEELQNRKIPRNLSNSMEGMLSTTELTNCLFKIMKGSSSPGTDGFTVNYVRVFWEDLKTLTTNALNASFGNTLTTSLKKAIVKLLRKGTKDPTLAGNYRPISLLSIFYKLASCAITQRIKPAVEAIIGRQQKAYIKHNNIGSCIINIINLIKHTIKKKKSALILLIDFKKAFDSISHTFINNTLKTLGFGPDIITWISTFLKDRDAQILTGGHLTDKIVLEQGVPQGDIISPYLFIIMVEILLIKITTTEHITGITYAKHEARAETFADDTTLFMERSEKNLRNATKYVKHFHQISGLACNIDKTQVIPIGKNSDKNDTICKELNMVWEDTFTILGFEIDNKLQKLDINFEKAKAKIQALIRKWKPYHLSLRGRLTITKTKLISQITYISTVLTPNQTAIHEMQTMINNFVMGIDNKSKNWISRDTMYTPIAQGGIGMIKLDDFMKAIKVSWIKRYSIDKINDNWADIIDDFLHISPDTRHIIHKYGPERFNKIISADIPVISSLFDAFKTFKHQFPTKPNTMDNSWINQSVFFNLNITRKQPNTKQKTFLKPTFYGIPDEYHTLSLKELYPSGIFISNTALNTLTSTTILNMQYNNLKTHIKAHIGPGKKYDAIAKEKLPQKIHTFADTHDLMDHTKKGSGAYRRVIKREHPPLDTHNPDKWNKKLKTNNITRDQVKKAMRNLHSPYLDSACADHLTRLKLGKTLFKNQLFAIGITDDNSCNTCEREYNIQIMEDYKHAMYECPAVQSVIQHIKNIFFHNTNTNLSIGDILLSMDNKKQNINDKDNRFTNLVWDLFQVYIIKCRTEEKTPIASIALFEIRAQINRILKILPHSNLAKIITSSHTTLQTLQNENT